MRLTDIMSGAGLSIYPQIGLVIFLAVFISIILRLYSRRARDDHRRWAALPLDEPPVIAATPPGGHP